ncbi:hypothetical protein [Phenylobacterium sp.]|uniref:hypothetical protein n=1 Tax=Phenylobacterium sp. TaxID=1871053 RepID=UPI0035C7F7FA
MAEMTPSEAPRRRFDPLTAVAVVFFLMAVAFAAAPAINAGPATLAGLMLLVGLAGVACLGLFVLRSSLEAPAEHEPSAERLVEALDEPAALAAVDGRIHACNAAWRDAVGEAPRLPKSGASAASLFSALAAARRGEAAHAQLKLAGAEHHVEVAPVGEEAWASTDRGDRAAWGVFVRRLARLSRLPRPYLLRPWEARPYRLPGPRAPLRLRHRIGSHGGHPMPAKMEPRAMREQVNTDLNASRVGQARSLGQRLPSTAGPRALLPRQVSLCHRLRRRKR